MTISSSRSSMVWFICTRLSKDGETAGEPYARSRISMSGSFGISALRGMIRCSMSVPRCKTRKPAREASRSGPAKSHSRQLLLATSGQSALQKPCPLYPRKWAFTGIIDLSAKCQKQTCAVQGPMSAKGQKRTFCAAPKQCPRYP